MEGESERLSERYKALIDEQWERMKNEFSDLPLEKVTDSLETHTEYSYLKSKLRMLRAHHKALEERDNLTTKEETGILFITDKIREEIFQLSELSDYLVEEIRREKSLLEWEGERRSEHIRLNKKLEELVEGGEGLQTHSSASQDKDNQFEDLMEATSRTEMKKAKEFLEKKLNQFCERYGDDGYILRQYLQELISQYLNEKDPYVYISREHNEKYVDFLLKSGVASRNMDDKELMRIESFDMYEEE